MKKCRGFQTLGTVSYYFYSWFEFLRTFSHHFYEILQESRFTNILSKSEKCKGSDTLGTIPTTFVNDLLLWEQLPMNYISVKVINVLSESQKRKGFNTLRTLSHD